MGFPGTSEKTRYKPVEPIEFYWTPVSTCFSCCRLSEGAGVKLTEKAGDGIESVARSLVHHFSRYLKDLGVASSSILFNHRSCQQPDPFSLGFRRFSRRIPGKNGKGIPRKEGSCSPYLPKKRKVKPGCQDQDFMVVGPQKQSSPKAQYQARVVHFRRYPSLAKRLWKSKVNLFGP